MTIGYQAYNQEVQNKRIEKLESSIAGNYSSKSSPLKQESGGSFFPDQPVDPDFVREIGFKIEYTGQ